MGSRCLGFTAPVFALVLLLLLQNSVGEERGFACKSLSFPFCDTTRTVEERVNDLISRLNLKEKILLSGSVAPNISRLGIPAYEWWQEALHGVANSPGVNFSGPIKAATSFPQPILTAASFNDTLFNEIGQVISTEARAMYNEGQTGLTFWTPNINIFRDPRWGRGQETPGEDPVLSGNYAAAFVRGMQATDNGHLRSIPGSSSSGSRLKTSACCKHFTAYDLEKWGDADRDHFNAEVTKQDMEDTYNPPFQSCIEDGKASSLMCAYNKINGIPACANYNLLTETARNNWGFEGGYRVQDVWPPGCVYDMINEPAYAKTLEDAVAFSFMAGMDLNCGPTSHYYAELALSRDKMKESDLDRALHNLFSVQMRLGLFDGDPKSQIYGDLGVNDVCTQENQALALQAALQSIVLMKNNRDTLPLLQEKIKFLAVLGPSAADEENRMLGNYAGIPCIYVSPLEGLSHYISNIQHVQGCTEVSCETENFSLAESAASKADAVVIVVGLSLTQENEGFDRTSLLLPGHQQKLISVVAKVAKGPIVLVIISGGPVDISFAKENPKISSILWAGYPGQAGGQAIAEVIFGDYNPGGKLPMTWYPESFTTVPMTNMNMRPNKSTGYPGRTYRFYTGEPVFSFGHGLSYTRFKHIFMSAPSVISIPSLKQQTCYQRHSLPKFDLNQCTEAEVSACRSLIIQVEVLVRNEGDRRGSDVVILYAMPPQSGRDGIVLKKLVAYERVDLEAGSEHLLVFTLVPCRDLWTVKENGEKSLDLGKHVLLVADDVQHPIFFVNPELESM